MTFMAHPRISSPRLTVTRSWRRCPMDLLGSSSRVCAFARCLTRSGDLSCAPWMLATARSMPNDEVQNSWWRTSKGKAGANLVTSSSHHSGMAPEVTESGSAICWRSLLVILSEMSSSATFSSPARPSAVGWSAAELGAVVSASALHRSCTTRRICSTARTLSPSPSRSTNARTSSTSGSGTTAFFPPLLLAGLGRGGSPVSTR
mmetsp:Transcript_12945/g.20341  ORF Transcript_12945/g.20341 Transcript_12945/m.20341 type:complete len:204 (+) Transcript_12945:1403-2014(+)